MQGIAKFEAISIEQFFKDNGKDTTLDYKEIKLPKRATVGSAGYDLFAPEDITINPGESVKIPTNIRCQIDNGWVLNLYPRSGLGFKHRIQLDNTVGIVDSDYYEADNEGHIFVKITYDTKDVNAKPVTIKAGDGFAQGVFLPFGVTKDDVSEGLRTGGFGSTTKQ